MLRAAHREYKAYKGCKGKEAPSALLGRKVIRVQSALRAQ